MSTKSEEMPKASQKKLYIEIGVLAFLLIVIILSWLNLPVLACHGVKYKFTSGYSLMILRRLGPRAAEALFENYDIFREDSENSNEYHYIVKNMIENIKTLNDAELFLDSFSNINVRGYYEITPLHWVLGYENYFLAKYLIENDADINAKDKDGRTPLNYTKDKGMAKYISEHGGRRGPEWD